MPEYISREAVLAQKGDCYDKDGHLLYAVGTGNILRIPAADVVEVRHGRWLTTPTGWVYCSVCGEEPPEETNARTKYCPNCGAKMDGGQDETQAGPYDLLYEEGGYNSNGV